jgi:hypothetical protein
MQKKVLILVTSFALASLLGCSSEYPKFGMGDVSGTAFYEGSALARTPKPALVIGAFPFDPGFLSRISAGEKPVPHAAYYVANPVFTSQGISYRLSNLEPYDQGYFVTAAILDMTDAAAAATVTGIYPDLGILSSNPERGPVQPVAGFTLTNIDLRMADAQVQ